MATFSEIEMESFFRKGNRVMALHELIDWSEFEKVLKKVSIHKNEVFSQGGQIAHEPLKCLRH